VGSSQIGGSAAAPDTASAPDVVVSICRGCEVGKKGSDVINSRVMALGNVSQSGRW
jgi:hypothetical protein